MPLFLDLLLKVLAQLTKIITALLETIVLVETRTSRG